MSDAFRILDRFMITGRGEVYLIQNYSHSTIHIGDTFYDLQGNRFKVKSIEMFGSILEDNNISDIPLGLLFEYADGIAAKGNLLVRDLNDVNFIFCNHPLYPRRVDEDYEEEYQAAGLEHACALFSYENLQSGKLSLYGEEISGLTIYRGWMMKPEMYKLFYSKLEEKGIFLINTPEEYERCHLLPGWYSDFKECTPFSIWENTGSIESAIDISSGLTGPYIVKDYVKSRKHEWYDACYISNIEDKPNAEKVIRNFINRQGESLIGGAVLRQFVKLKENGFHEKSGMPLSEEYRVFVFAGEIQIIDDYWHKDGKVVFSEEDMEWIESQIKGIRSNFATMDIARREDGKLIIMEIGDGQVSGLQQIEADDFYKSFNPEVLRLGDSPVEEFFEDGTVIMCHDPLPNKTIVEMRRDIDNISSPQELVDAYVDVHNKFWYIEDDLYDYEEGTDEYNKTLKIVDAWGAMMDELDEKIMEQASREGLLIEKETGAGTVKRLEAFMAKYGYRDGNGWWVKLE